MASSTPLPQQASVLAESEHHAEFATSSESSGDAGAAAVGESDTPGDALVINKDEATVINVVTDGKPDWVGKSSAMKAIPMQRLPETEEKPEPEHKAKPNVDKSKVKWVCSDDLAGGVEVMWFPHHVNDPMVLNRYFGEYMVRHSDPSDANIDVQRLKDISFSLGGGMEDERDEADGQLSRFLGSDLVPNLIQGISFPTPVPMILVVVGRDAIHAAQSDGWSGHLHAFGAEEGCAGGAAVNKMYRVVLDKSRSIVDMIWYRRTLLSGWPNIGNFFDAYKATQERLYGEEAFWHFGKFISTVDFNLSDCGVSQSEFAHEPIGKHRFGPEAVNCGTSHKYVFYPERDKSAKLYFTAIVMRLMFRSELPPAEGGTKSQSKKRRVSFVV